MTAKDFFMLVSEMRQAQKEYFSTRSPGSLNRSKQLEHQVDNEIQRVNEFINTITKPKEGELWQDTNFQTQEII